MRIALVSTPFVATPPRGYGGTELVVHHLVRGLSALGHEVVLFATGDSEGPDVRFVYQSPVWPPDPAADAIHSRAVARAIARERFDVVHAHTPGFLDLGRDLDVPTVYTIHHARDERLLRLYCSRPDVRWVAISRRQAELVPELSCAVVHHGIDVTARRGGGGGDYVLFLGRLSLCKGPDLAIQAAIAADMDIVVAGTVHDEPDTPPEWARHIRALLREPRVHAIGGVTGRKKDRLLRRARALVAPIRWEEPFGLALIEAMLHGTPVVATRLGAAPEIVDEGVTGVLVEEERELAPALRFAMGLDREACRRRARARFGAERMVRDYLRVYRDVSAAPSRAEAEYLSGAT